MTTSVFRSKQLDCRVEAPAMTSVGPTTGGINHDHHHRSARLHRMARRAPERSQRQGDRRLVQDAGRAAAAEGRLSRRRIFRARCSSTSTRCPIIPIRCRTCFLPPSSSAAMSAGSGSAMTTPSCSTIPAAGSRHPGCGGCSCRSAQDVRILNGGLKKWVAEGRKVESGRGDAEAGDVQGGVRCAAHAQHAAAGRQSRKPGRAGDRCARQRTLSGQGGRAAAGPSLRPYPGQPQPALQQPVRCRDRHDEIAGRIARGVRQAPA